MQLDLQGDPECAELARSTLLRQPTQRTGLPPSLHWWPSWPSLSLTDPEKRKNCYQNNIEDHYTTRIKFKQVHYCRQNWKQHFQGTQMVTNLRKKKCATIISNEAQNVLRKNVLLSDLSPGQVQEPFDKPRHQQHSSSLLLHANIHAMLILVKSVKSFLKQQEVITIERKNSEFSLYPYLQPLPHQIYDQWISIPLLWIFQQS